MVRWIKMSGLCVVAAFALNTVVAGAAQAAPSWTVKGVELKAGETAAVSSHGVAGVEAVEYVPSYAFEIACKSVESTGEILGGNPGTGRATISYKECRATNVKGETLTACNVQGGTGAKKGEIINKVTSELGFLPGSKMTKVVNDVRPESGTSFVTLKVTGESCSLKGEYELKGSVSGEVTPVGSSGPNLTTTFAAKLTKNAEGGVSACVQEPTAFETASGELVESQLSFGAHTMCLTKTETLELASKGEVGVRA
jgi:hypothetical protein